MSIICRFFRPAEVQRLFVPRCPLIQGLGDKLGTVVYTNDLWQAVPCYDPVQDTHDIPSFEVLASVDLHALTGKAIDDR